MAGFKPYGPPKQVEHFKAKSTVYPGDLVELTATGDIQPIDAATDLILGVALGYAKAGEECPVCVAPDQLYVCEGDGQGATRIDASAVGEGRDIVLGTADTLYKRSGMKVDEDGSLNDTVIIIDKLDEPDNDWGKAGIKLLVKINKHQFFGKDAATEV